MIDMDMIENEIEKLENQKTDYNTCSKLAVLYSIRDHSRKSLHSYSYGQSEFLQACANAEIDKVLYILDEHMDTIKILYPKEYNTIIRMIKDSK